VTHYQDANVIAEVSRGLGQPMSGIAVGSMAEGEKLAKRGW
jgi:pyridoxal 5'-phosphate synthase pdxS subunit